MVKRTQTIRRLLPKNCLSMFDHFVGLALKGLKKVLNQYFVSRTAEIICCYDILENTILGIVKKSPLTSLHPLRANYGCRYIENSIVAYFN